MSAPYFSVIMPVYGVEKYLRDTLDSVLRQTFADFELILVDDCSKDGSGKICDEVAASDGRVRVIHKEKNGGASSARNLGTKSASGKYLYYMDSDDKIDSDIFEKMYSASRDASPTVVMFGAVEEYYDKTGKLYMTNPVSYERKALSGKENVAKEVIKIENTTLFGYLWNKIYLKDAVFSSGVTFCNMPLNEDFKFNIDFFRYVDSMVILDDTAYHYAKRDNQSLTCRFVKNYFELQEMRINELLGFYRENGMCDGDILKNLAGIYVRSVFSALEKNNDKRSGMSGKDRKDWLKAQLKSELYKELMPYAEPDSRLVKIMANRLKGGNTGVLLFTGKFISAVKKSFPSLFSGLKLKK